MCFIGYSYYSYAYVPKKRQVKKLRIELDSIESEIRKARTDADYLEKMQKEIKKVEQRWNYVQKKIPPKKQMPQILEELAKAADGSNIYYVSIVPEGVRRYSAIMIKNLTYEKLPIKINLQCRYKDFGGYLKKLNNLNRLIKVEDIEINTNETIRPLIDVTLIVSTYVVSEQ